MQKQYKQIFSEEAVQQMYKRLKQQPLDEDGAVQGGNDESLLDVHATEVGSVQKGESDTIKFYGDQMCFEYRLLLDQNSGKSTIDTKFSAQADVSCAIVAYMFV